MARLFDDASSQFLEVDAAGVTAAPLTGTSWFNSNDATAAQAAFDLADKDVDTDEWLFAIRGDVGGDPVDFIARDGATGTASSSTGYTANTWHHGAAIERSATDRSSFIDGGSEGTDATTVSPNNIDRTSIGRRGKATPGAYFSGQLAEAAIWNVDIGTTLLGALARGVNPFAVRPADRVFLAPVHGNESPEPDYDLQNNLTVTGAVKGSSNPPVELLENYL